MAKLGAPAIYDHRSDPEPTGPQRAEHALVGWLRRSWLRLAGPGLTGVPRRVEQAADGLRHASDAQLAGLVGEVTGLLRREGVRGWPVARSFALIRELADRKLGERHYDVQLMGGMALLRGLLAEMETGEGKTLTATLTAGTMGLAGRRVHVITVNDYLADRDAGAMAPLYQALGLSVGRVVTGMSSAERRTAYAADVVYASNKQLAADHLRDRRVLRQSGSDLRLMTERLTRDAVREGSLLLSGLDFAIVDEAASVLVDEARTSIILSETRSPDDAESQVAQEAVTLVDALEPGEDFETDAHERRVSLTARGRARLSELAADKGGPWAGQRRREETARQALVAVHLLQRDVHYVVRDGKVVIVDEFTGRPMPDRSWGEQLQQMVEAKEGVALSDRAATVAQMTYQRFFRRYHGLAGMTGTAREVSGELWTVYGLLVTRLPTNRPMRRRYDGAEVLVDNTAKWTRIAERARAQAAAGRPVLIGTRSVAASQSLSAELSRLDCAHQMLTAAQDADEAAVVAAAGEAGRVTVATNMAGRGTDIVLADEARAAGGLHVIVAELNDARRVDRQLAGRCARQGDPGSYAFVVALDEPVLRRPSDAAARRALRTLRSVCSARLWSALAWGWLRAARWRLERDHRLVRDLQLRSDQNRASAMAFAGERE